MAVVAVRKRPGLYYNTETGKYFSIVEYYDGDKYDTVVQGSGAITAGTQITLFRDLTNKERGDTNFDTPRRLSKGEEMLLKRVGVDIPLAFGNTVKTGADVKKALFGGYLRLQVNRIDIAEGLLYTFPSGYGCAGTANEVISNGVPSTTAQRQLEKVHELTSEHDISGTITYYDRLWDTTTNMATLDGRVHHRVFLGGLIRRAATK